MDVWQLIAHDHAYLAHLITEVRHAFGPNPAHDRGEILSGLIDELAAHAEALEASLYGPLRQLDRTRQLVEDLHHEHRQFIEQLDNLAWSRLSDRPRHSGITLDVAMIGQHLRRYTQELIPAAREVLTSAQVDAAAHAFVRAKMRTLQSRQHRRFIRPSAREITFLSVACATVASLSYFAGRAASIKRS